MLAEHYGSNEEELDSIINYYTVNREIAVSLEQSNPRVVVQPALPGALNPLIPNMTEYYDINHRVKEQ